MIAPQRISVACPACRTPVTAELYTIVDVTEDPELKRRFLAGRLNMAACPNCRQTFQVGGALMYHDGHKDLLTVFLPSQANLANQDRQRIIGDLTRRTMDSLPPEQRRAYLFQPKEFLTLNGMIEAILAADGITPEMMRAQQERAQLVNLILRSATSEEALRATAQAYDAQIDYDFFVMLSAMAEQAAAAGDQRAAAVYATLHNQLMGMTSFGERVLAQQAAADSITPQTTRDELLEKVMGASDDELVAYVTVGRPLIDYVFYQQLAARIEDAERQHDKTTAQRLTGVRARVLELTQQIDAANRMVMEEATKFLQELLEAPDPLAALEANWDRVDNTFIDVLALNLSAAEQRGAKSVVSKLEQLMAAIEDAARAAQPPAVQLINDLMQAEYPTETRRLLGERRQEITPEVLEVMEALAQTLAEQGQLEVAKRLRDIRGQAMLVA